MTITPQEKYPALAKALGVDELYFKREDLHPYGSHKGRSIPFMIDHYVREGARVFAISSSGNAALAAALYIKKLNAERLASGQKNEDGQPDLISLDIYVGKKIETHKLAKIQAVAGVDSDQIRLVIVERPVQALAQAVHAGARSLRQSTNDVALEGYESLAEELMHIPKISAIFVGTSSGTTAQALAQYFLKHNKKIQVHIVQTSSCHPIVTALNTDGADPTEPSIADAIVDKVAMRKTALVPLIEKTGGRGWCATNEDISAAQKLVKETTDLNISTNSALSVVGVMRAIETARTGSSSQKITGTAVCLICGE